jgi:hypothetical protein
MVYFMLHDAGRFENRILPSLAASSRIRSFAPIVQLASELRPLTDDFANRYCLTSDEQPLLLKLSSDQPFDRRLWRHVAGEILLYAAAEAPPVQTAADTLAIIVSDDQRDVIRQAHAGSRDVSFDGILYRPGRAGMNHAADVDRIAAALTEIDTGAWNVEDLVADLADDPAEELAYAAGCLADLREMYVRARRNGQVVICEEI